MINQIISLTDRDLISWKEWITGQILVKLIISLSLFKMPNYNGYAKEKLHALMHVRLVKQALLATG